MAIRNDFLEFATDPFSFVLSQAEYEEDDERFVGQQSGIARAALNNKALRQGSAMAATIGSFMQKQGYNAIDDGLTDVRRDDFERAIMKLIQPSVDIAISTARLSILQTVFPVGSYYISDSVSTNPRSLLGFGTWQKVESRFLVGASSSYPAASQGGAATITLTRDQMPAHTHSAETGQGGSHSHTATTGSAGNHAHWGVAIISGDHTHTGSIENAGSHSHTRGTMEIIGEFRATDNDGSDSFANGAFTAENVGSGDEGNHGGELKKFTFTASRAWSGSTSSTGQHSHRLTIYQAGGHSHDLRIDATGQHTHTVTVNNGGSHSHSITVKSAGSGKPVTILPPYRAVFMWRRTA